MLIEVDDALFKAASDLLGLPENEVGDYIFKLGTHLLATAKGYVEQDHLANMFSIQQVQMDALVNRAVQNSTNEIVQKLNLVQMKSPTEKGQEFEELVGEVMYRQCLLDGEHLEATGLLEGNRKNQKVGDYLLTTAVGDRIGIEVKRDKSYTLKKVLDECRSVRDNRNCSICVFVYYAGYNSIKAYPLTIMNGNDILVLYDPANTKSEGYLESAFVLARAMLTVQNKTVSVDQRQIESILDVIKASMVGLKAIEAKSSDIIKLSSGIQEQVINNTAIIDRSISMLKTIVV